MLYQYPDRFTDFYTYRLGLRRDARHDCGHIAAVRYRAKDGKRRYRLTLWLTQRGLWTTIPAASRGRIVCAETKPELDRAVTGYLHELNDSPEVTAQVKAHFAALRPRIQPHNRARTRERRRR